MNRHMSWFGGRYKVHGHAQMAADPGGSGLPDPGEFNADVTRVIIRAKGPITVTLDGTDPTAADAMYLLKDEISVFDTDWTLIRVAGAGASIHIIYLGA